MKIFGAALEENRTITRIQMGKNNVLSQVACPPSHTIIHTNHSGKRGAGGRRSLKLPRKLLAKALSFFHGLPRNIVAYGYCDVVLHLQQIALRLQVR